MSHQAHASACNPNMPGCLATNKGFMTPFDSICKHLPNTRLSFVICFHILLTFVGSSRGRGVKFAVWFDDVIEERVHKSMKSRIKGWLGGLPWERSTLT